MKHVRPYAVLCTGGTYAVRFSNTEGTICNFSPGTREEKIAAKVARQIEKIMEAAAVGDALPAESAEWLASIPVTWRAKLAKLGVIDGARAAAMDPIAQHVKAFSDSFLPGRPRRSADVHTILTQFVEKAGIMRLTEVTRRTAERVCGQMATDGATPNTIRKTQQVAKQFCSWAVRQELLAANPIAEMEGVKGGTERERRALSIDEQRALLAWTAAAPDQVWHDRAGNVRDKISGAERALVYRLVIETGLRLSEVRSLTRDSFRLTLVANGKATPCVQLRAKNEKNRKGSTLRLRTATAKMIGEHIARKLPGARAFAMPKLDEAVGMIRRDLAGARAAWIGEAANPDERREREASTFLAEKDEGGAVFDFHALRVTFITNMARGGVPLQMAVKLARHSDPKLTVNIYTKAGVQDTEEAIDRLPDLDSPLPGDMATGTHG
jgi:site-specific recombinase XerD